jgi:glyoxylase-like metal-dependent hydrolase (beta-lactamase superfamily II)
MKRIMLAALAATALTATSAYAQGVDFSKVEIKTIDLGNKTYRLEGQGGNITLAVGSDGILMVDTQFAPLHDKLMAAIRQISPLPIKTIIVTHFHGDHTGGIAGFQKDGATVLSQDNIRIRLLAGTTNGTTGAKMAPQSGDAIPKQTYIGGKMTVEVGGRKALVEHINNAHTDGDSIVYLADANVLATGDIMNNNHGYQQPDFANGGDIRGMVRGTDEMLKLINDQTKVNTGHGPLGNKQSVVDYNAMVKKARDIVEKMVRAGMSESEVVAADPLKELNATWARDKTAADNFVKQVYQSFYRS